MVVLTLAIMFIRLVYRLLAHRPVLRTFISMACLAVLYFAAVLVAGVLTSESLVAPGTVKCFDDWCVTVTHAAEYSSLSGVSPLGRFIVVDVKVLAESRRVVQKGSDPHVYLIDAKGHKYEPSPAAQASLEKSAGTQLPLTNPVGPGDSFITRQAFDIPKDSGNLRVLVTEQPWITKIVLFNENSFLSGRTLFVIDPKPES